MTTSFKLTVIAAVLAASTLAGSVQAAAAGAARRANRNQPRPRPAPAAPVSPPPPRHPAMEDAAFGALVASVRDKSFSDAQVTVIEHAATRNYFSVAQVQTLIDLVALSAARLRALELCAPRIVDAENVLTVVDAFAFSADKAQARQILRRNGF
jgi:Domain of unknown function (DUF4476)